jgi:quinol monooxygenase YgiN
MAITVVSRIKAKAGMEEELKKELMALINPTRSEEGCINYDLHQSTDNKSLFLFYENWTSKDALDEHMNKPHLDAFKKKDRKLIAEPLDVTLWEKIVTDDQMVKKESEIEADEVSYAPSEEIMEKSKIVVTEPVEEEKKHIYRFEESFSSNGPDNEGWNLNEWDLHDSNHTGENSKSLYGEARSNFGTVTKTASVTVELGYSAILQYYRKLELYGANIMSNAAFKVIIDDGSEHIVDEKSQKFGNYTEGSWVERSGIDLSSYGGKTVKMKFVATVTDPASIVSYAKVWIDDITISDETQVSNKKQ